MAAHHAFALADDIVAHGFGAFDSELAELLDDARRSAVNPVLVEVVGDPTAPTPVRERALGRMLMQLSRGSGTPSVPTSPSGRVLHRIAA